MPTPRNPLLLLVLILALTVVAGFWTYGVEAAEAGTLQVYPRPSGSGELPSMILAEASPEPGKVEPAKSPTRQPKAVVHLDLTTVARPLRNRTRTVQCELVTADAGHGDPGQWVAGTAATPLTRNPRGHQLARFDIDGVPHYRVVRLHGRETGVLRIRRGMSSVVRGRVLDAQGAPLAAAQVWLAGSAATTDTDGRFETEALPVGDGMPLVVYADGVAMDYRILGERDCHNLDAHPITMNRRGTRLHVRFFAPGESAATARFYILPAASKRDTRLLSYPLFWPAVVPLSASKDGTVTFEGLPWGVRIRVMVQYSSGPPVISEELVLDRFEAQCVIHGSASKQLAGRVVDANGQAVANAFLTARAGGTGLSLKGGTWLLPGAAYIRDAAVIQTAGDGSFAMPMVWGEGRTGLVSIEAPGLVGLEYSVSAEGETPRRFVLYPAGAQGQPELLLQSRDLPDFVHVLIHNEAGQRGPYPWLTEEAFELPNPRSAVVRVGLRVDEGELRNETVFVDGEQLLQVSSKR